MVTGRIGGPPDLPDGRSVPRACPSLAWPCSVGDFEAHSWHPAYLAVVREDAYRRCARNREDMSESNKPGPTEMKELMARVLDSDASEAFGRFMERRLALSDMAPTADDALLDGIEESPDGGAAMAQAHLHDLPDNEREELLERAAVEAGRRLHGAAFALLTAVGAARLPIDVTPEMVAVAAITELGDSVPSDAKRS
jgi:hypothetical protein